MNDDSALYTGVDNEPYGVFGNEKVSEDTEKVIQEQKALIGELTPKLKSLIDAIEDERKIVVDFIIEYMDNTKDSDEIMRGELKAAARYRKYLDGLKTKFTLALQEVNKNGN